MGKTKAKTHGEGSSAQKSPSSSKRDYVLVNDEDENAVTQEAETPAEESPTGAVAAAVTAYSADDDFSIETNLIAGNPASMRRRRRELIRMVERRESSSPTDLLCRLFCGRRLSLRIMCGLALVNIVVVIVFTQEVIPMSSDGNSKLVLAGGGASSGLRKDRSHEPATPASYPVARKLHTLSSTDNRHGPAVILFGGLTISSSLDDMWIYQDRRWQELQPSRRPPTRFGHSAATLRKDGTTHVVVFGGRDMKKKRWYSDLWYFTMDDSAWRRASIMGGTVPPARYAHVSAAAGESVYIHGGYGKGCSNPEGYMDCRDMWAFNMTTRVWTEQHGSLFRRMFHTAIPHISIDAPCLVFFGGLETVRYKVIQHRNDVWSYDPASGKYDTAWQGQGGSWRKPPGRYGHAGVDFDNSLLIFAGIGESISEGANDVWRFTFDGEGTGHWSQELVDGDMPSERFGVGMATMGSSVVLFGGTGKDAILDDTWEYSPHNHTWSRAHEGSAVSYSPRGCFVATAAYGSTMHPHLNALREFRDNVLLRFSLGRRFVLWYYSNSPPVAQWIATREWARFVTRVLLWPLVMTILQPVSAAATVVCAVVMFAYLIRKRA